MAFLNTKGVERLWSHIISKLNKKVDKIEGKGLSTNDYTTEEKTKLSNLVEGANANVQSDWNQNDETADDYIKNRPCYSYVGNVEITWDGDVTGLTSVSGFVYKVSDIILDDDSIKIGSFSVYENGATNTINFAGYWDQMAGAGYVTEDIVYFPNYIIFTRKENASMNGVVIAEPGIYFALSNGNYVSRFSTIATTNKVVDANLLPKVDWNRDDDYRIHNKPFGDKVTNKFLWNDNDETIYVLGGYEYYYISDIAPTYNELLQGFQKELYTNGRIEKNNISAERASQYITTNDDGTMVVYGVLIVPASSATEDMPSGLYFERFNPHYYVISFTVNGTTYELEQVNKINKKYLPTMVGTFNGKSGARGVVPTPYDGDEMKALIGAGEWAELVKPYFYVSDDDNGNITLYIKGGNFRTSGS